MFSHLFRAAQATVDNAVGQVMNAIIVAVPFLVALGFGTAALYMRLTREHDAETASLVLGGLYGAMGLVGVLVLLVKNRAPAAATPAVQDDRVAEPPSDEVRAALSATDQELLAAAASTVLPMALPTILRLITRNLPVLLAIAAIVVALLKREDEAAVPTEPVSQPVTA